MINNKINSETFNCCLLHKVPIMHNYKYTMNHFNFIVNLSLNTTTA